MTTAVLFSVEQKDIIALEHAQEEYAPTVYGIGRPGRLRWVGHWLPRLTFGWQGLKQDICPFRIRWGWALLLSIVLILTIGECGPAASAITTLP